MSNNRAGRQLFPVQERETRLSKEKQLVQAEAQSRLRRSGYHQLSLILCEFHEGVLTLRGHVPSFHMKQVAQTLIRDLDGVEDINNRIEVAAAIHDRTEGNVVPMPTPSEPSVPLPSVSKSDTPTADI